MRCDRFCVVVSCALSLVLGCSKSSSNGFAERDGFSCDGGLCLPVDATPLITVATCETEGGTAPVQAPQLVKTISGTGTAWFASPIIVDLDGDGKMELVGTTYDVFVMDSTGKEIARVKSGQYHKGRVYAPAVVADLDGDGIVEIVVGGSECTVAAYEFKDGALTIKKGWPVKACIPEDKSVEVRGMAAADLDGDGTIEVVVTTTQDGDGSQVYVYRPDGSPYQPDALRGYDAWPRYNKNVGLGGDLDANGCGHRGYGAYGLNVAIGNIDDDPQLEIIVTYDNHHIQAFKIDGTAILAAPFFRNRSSECSDQRLSWGQFIRWYDPEVEKLHYNLHQGEWPSPTTAIWLQWTASRPSSPISTEMAATR